MVCTCFLLWLIRLTLWWELLAEWTILYPLENSVYPKFAFWSWMSVYVELIYLDEKLLAPVNIRSQVICSTYWLITVNVCAIAVQLSSLLFFDSLCAQDGLLSAGYSDFINRIHNQIPQVTSDGKRLQVTVWLNCLFFTSSVIAVHTYIYIY